MYIPKEVEAKIRHICSIIHDVEWSGTLFYKYKGSLDTGDFEVTCVDLFVMDIGSSAYTEYKESVDVISYRAQNDLLGEDIFEGLIHSHNSMPTFFSGTDCSTLSEEGTNSNHFVSLIVNNAGVYTAAVTRRVVTESVVEATIKTTSTKYYDTYNNERVTLSQDDVKEETKTDTKTSSVVEYFNLDIVKEEADYPFQDIDTRLAEIKKSKTKTVVTSKYTPTTPSKSPATSYPSYNPYNHSYGGYRGYPYPTVFDDDVDDPSDDIYDMRGHVISSASGGSGNTFQSKMEKEEKEEKEEETVETVNEIPLCLQESFDKDLIEHISLQLLTGSIIISNDAISASDWVKKMDAVYERRFGYLDEAAHPSINKQLLLDNNVRLEQWVESMIEFLVYTRDEDLISRLNIIGEPEGIEYDEADTAEVCAYDMFKYLSALPDSYVKNKMLETLNTYIPDGIEAY